MSPPGTSPRTSSHARRDVSLVAARFTALLSPNGPHVQRPTLNDPDALEPGIWRTVELKPAHSPANGSHAEALSLQSPQSEAISVAPQGAEVVNLLSPVLGHTTSPLFLGNGLVSNSPSSKDGTWPDRVGGSAHDGGKSVTVSVPLQKINGNPREQPRRVARSICTSDPQALARISSCQACVALAPAILLSWIAYMCLCCLFNILALSDHPHTPDHPRTL